MIAIVEHLQCLVRKFGKYCERMKLRVSVAKKVVVGGGGVAPIMYRGT